MQTNYYIKDLGNNAVCERAEAYQSTARSRIFLVMLHVCFQLRKILLLSLHDYFLSIYNKLSGLHTIFYIFFGLWFWTLAVFMICFQLLYFIIWKVTVYFFSILCTWHITQGYFNVFLIIWKVTVYFFTILCTWHIKQCYFLYFYSLELFIYLFIIIIISLFVFTFYKVCY